MVFRVGVSEPEVFERGSEDSVDEFRRVFRTERLSEFYSLVYRDLRGDGFFRVF